MIAGAPPSLAVGVTAGVGVGVEVTSVGLRAVVVTPDRGEVGGPTVAVRDSIETAFAELVGDLALGRVPTWLAWNDGHSAFERVELTSSAPLPLLRSLDESARAGAAPAALERRPDGTRHLILARWNQLAVHRAVRAAISAGTDVAGCVPAARARSWAASGDPAAGAARAAAGLVDVRGVSVGEASGPVPPTPDPWVIERIGDPPAASADPVLAPRWRRRRGR